MNKITCIIIATAALASLIAVAAQGSGPDVQYTAIHDMENHGAVGGLRAYSLGTTTCNIGNQDLQWLFDGTPGVGFNMYRLDNGRLTQLGLGFVKTACCAAAGFGCAGPPCNGNGGSVLGAGCQDVYWAGWNAIQSALAPRSAVNAWTGGFTAFAPTSGNAIFRRMQVAQTDLNTTNFPGALYFVEGVYVGSDDAANGNRNNNATYRQVTVNQSTFDFGLEGGSFVGLPAIRAWRDHGNGLNNPDTSVALGELDVPSEGRFHYAFKVKDNLNGTWRYEYAVFNLSSDRSGGSLTIPIPAGTTITGAGFSSPNYHSDEAYSNADWSISIGSTSVTWATPQTFAQNPNSSALRWGTMYNFWFDATRPPGNANATLGLFKPHTTQSVQFTVSAPAVNCPADTNASSGVDVDDLLAVIAGWGPCANPRNCPPDIAPAGGNDAVDVDDLLMVISNWGPCS